MGQVLALIPARSGSKGIPGKNFRPLGGKPLWQHAYECAKAAGCEPVMSSDANILPYSGEGLLGMRFLQRPAELAQDDTPMTDVVKHALAQTPGPPDDIIVLLQPTQPLRKPEHVREAVRLLQETWADSVVSVVELPLTHDWTFQLRVDSFGRLVPWIHRDWTHLPAGRQDVLPSYIRDGTVYAFTRATVERHGTIYGQDARPLIIDPADTCELDTEADWAAVVARWERER